MAKIFNTIDGGMQSFFQGKILSEIDASLPNIKIIGKNMTCTSEAIQFADLGAQVFVHGKTDGIAEDLDSKGYVIVDYKTSMPKPEHLLIYSAQLHSYAFAFSKAAENAVSFAPVTRLGLLVYEPQVFNVEGVEAQLNGKITWTELEMNKKWFREMLHDVAGLLMQTEAPEPNPDCSFCKYCDSINNWQGALVAQ
jgi:CRISPR/Cas system-associated exonuclease Cas4 (RecB family)